MVIRMREMIYPPKPRPGDRVAVISPSAGLPARFPAVYELGLRRLRDVLGLEPVEYPTTRAYGASAAERARDIHDAFADPGVTAVLATIGGDDQITVLPHLDGQKLAATPKPFFGYSDNTNLLHHLWRHGVVGYHGGSVMVHLGRAGATHRATTDSLRAALFTPGWYDLAPAAAYGEEAADWSHPDALDAEPPMLPGSGWTWDGPPAVVEAPTWGGNLEIVSWLLQAGRVGPAEDYAGCVLMLETSEEMPSAVEVYRILRHMGERGLLAAFPAVLVGRPKCWEFARPLALDERRRYAADQKDAIRRALATYRPDAVVVFDLDIGHTDPQLIIPYGGLVRVDGHALTVSVRY